MDTIEVTGQLKFLEHVGKILPANVSLVNEIADLLEISIDSAYRRLRGETSLSFDEITTICQRYKISFDAVTQAKGEIVNFWYEELNETQEDFARWFNSIKIDLKTTLENKAARRHLSYTAQGVPIFHYFKYEWLSAFKMHYWMRAILNVPEFQNKKFRVEDVNPELIEAANVFYQAYQVIPSTELWTDTTLVGVLEQVQFYWDSGVFESTEDALKICNELRDAVDRVEQQAQAGYKFLGGDPNKKGGSFDVYYSEIEFENNCIMLESDDIRSVYLGHLSFRSLKTNHQRYCQETSNWFENLKTKSHLISGLSETTRYKYFRRSHKKLDQLVSKIESD